MHLCIPECKRERGTTRQQGGSVSQVSRGEWPGIIRRLHQQGLNNDVEIRYEILVRKNIIAIL